MTMMTLTVMTMLWQKMPVCWIMMMCTGTPGVMIEYECGRVGWRYELVIGEIVVTITMKILKNKNRRGRAPFGDNEFVNHDYISAWLHFTGGGGGSVREEGRAASLIARAQTGAALTCFHSELKGSQEQCVDEPETRKKGLPFNLRVPLFCLLVLPHGVMSVCRAALVLLCSVLAVTLARRSSPEQEDVQEKINSARCTSRCLSLHMTQLTVAFRHLQVLTDTFTLFTNLEVE